MSDARANFSASVDQLSSSLDTFIEEMALSA